MLHSPRTTSKPRILVDCANYFSDNENNGDKAVFSVAARRLFEIWPDANMTWITLDAHLIRRIMPDVSPHTLQTRHTWRLFDGAKKVRAADHPPRVIDRLWRWMMHKKFLAKASLRSWRAAQAYQDQKKLLEIYQNTDLVITLGGGAFSDHFAGHAIGLLDTLEGGMAFGVPTALLSCGFEQTHNLMLNKKARSVLPDLSIIGCREGGFAPGYLESIGVDAANYAITGDEAVEMAYQMRPAALGDAIGVNIRQSSYAELERDDILQQLSDVLFRASRTLNAQLIPVPISMFGPSDPQSIMKILPAQDPESNGGADLDTPEKVIQQVGRCRLVVTGSYHAAVFALSQGIPVVSFAHSHHYLKKFAGLVTQFGQACTLIDLSTNGQFDIELDRTIMKLWNMADELRPGLLHAAQEQVQAGRNLYKRLRDLVV
jgi:polysaccharide pyruvyl transferase WcaK-like protein